MAQPMVTNSPLPFALLSAERHASFRGVFWLVRHAPRGRDGEAVTSSGAFAYDPAAANEADIEQALLQRFELEGAAVAEVLCWHVGTPAEADELLRQYQWDEEHLPAPTLWNAVKEKVAELKERAA